MKTNKLGLLLLSLIICAIFAIPTAAAEIQEVKADSGLIVFYRVSKMKGAAIRFQINDSAKGSIGALSNGSILQEYREPGDHTFTVRSPSVDGQDSITLKVEAGQVYYVKGEILWGWPAGRPKFSKISESEAQAEIKNIQ